MTSEGPHHPGQEPDEVSPGAGGPAPYGDRPAQPGNGYGAAGPDLGWAPPPPAAPNSPAPAWAAQQDQPPAAWGAAPTSPAAQPGQPAPWAATSAPQPGWGGQPEQSGQGWAGEQPGWTNTQPSARGAAQVPPPATPPQTWPQEDPARSGGWTPQQAGGPSPQNGQPGAGWGGQQPGPANGGWADGTTQDDPATSGGWNGAAQATPAWAQAEQGSPAWAGAPAARGAAQVPTADAGAEGWAPQQDPGSNGGWAEDAQRDQQSETSGGWGAGTATPQDPGQPWGAAPEDRPRQPDWVLAQDQDRPQDDPGPAQSDPARSGGWAAEPNAGAPARASASVPGTGNPPQWTPSERPAVPDVEPWAPGEAWGRTDADSANRPAERAEDGPIYQPAPAPGISPANVVPLPPQEQRVPGASLAAEPPADYAPPADFAPPAPYGAADGQPGERNDWPPAGPTGHSHEPEQAGWGQADARNDAPSAPVVPAPRTSPEAGAARATASAAVPLASRVMPPPDQPVLPAGAPAPQPRVYGRPTRPEAADEPEQAAGQAYGAEQPAYGAEPQAYGAEPQAYGAEPQAYGAEQQAYGADARPETGPDSFDDRDRIAPASNGYLEAPPSSGPPAPPPFPPGMPTFTDAPSSNRPVNGVRPHPGGERPADPFGPPAPASPDHGMPGVAGYGPPPMPEQQPAHTTAFPPAFPPPPQQQQSTPSWAQGAPDTDQSRFDAFKPDEEPKTEAPTPKVRNGRVLAAVLTAAVLILAVPLGLLFLLGKIGGDQAPAAFDPAVGSCVKQSGQSAAPADCGEAGAFTVVSKVDNKDKCGDPSLPHVVLQGDGPNRVLCLKPATSQ
ncbi:LppU/SCO3897 family protein [Micromonospora globbae]|uniref:LppU/SCO3897 family protein n=1 Tax=Micromonospora globbae TaxID=1894969 RepID=UPI00342E9575